MKKIFLTITLISLSLALSAQCSPQSLIQDDFEGHTAGGGLPACWKSAGSFGLITGVRNTAGESYSGSNYISIYTFFTANATVYIVSPELSTIDGNHFAEFFVDAENVDVTFEYGTMSDPADVNTFSSVSGASLTTNAYTRITTGNIPANSGHHYFAMKFTAPTMHSLIKIDDFSWQEQINVGLENSDAKKDVMKICPNPAMGDHVEIHSPDDISGYDMMVFNAVGQKIFDGKASRQIDISTWEKGIYVLHLSNKTSKQILKLIVS